jgi:septum formation protein
MKPDAISPTLWLASKSPRRAELLRSVGVAFNVLADIDVDETEHAGEAPARYVGRIVRAKTEAACARLAGEARWLALVADTTVTLDDAILGKPANIDEARDMLRRLSGKTHTVLTGVAVSDGKHTETLLHRTAVTFRSLKPDEVRRYTESKEPYDKAGGYGIQGPAAAFVTHIDGSHSGVMGLPLGQVVELLGQFGVRPN